MNYCEKCGIELELDFDSHCDECSFDAEEEDERAQDAEGEAPTTPQPERSHHAIFADQYCGDYYGIQPQQANESDSAFVGRVSGMLRSQGHLTEAHEVHNGCRWDSQDNPNGAADVVAGLMGAIAIGLNPQARYGANVSRFGDEARAGESIVGDEYVAGKYLQVKAENPDPSPEAMLLRMELLGRR